MTNLVRRTAPAVSPTSRHRDRCGKYAMRAIASMSSDESIAYTETQIALLAMTDDAKEGPRPSPPAWPGKSTPWGSFQTFSAAAGKRVGRRNTVN
jgi:hypothetical protein